MKDIYVYPETSVLINKLDIQDSKKLDEKENALVALNLASLLSKPIKIKTVFDIKAIHKLLFFDLYDWAGENRKINMYKNYTIIKEKYIPMIRSKALILKHDKTGANIEIFINEDKHYACNIYFRCPTINSTGVKHIIEHSALCGSRKYPIKEPFLELKKTSAYTYLNALTSYGGIEFPFSSANLKDFRNIMDIYLDGAFNPNFLNNKNIFLREGWRYEYDEKTDSLSYNGVVYNEMLGSFSDSAKTQDYNIDQAVFKNSNLRYNAGGFPDDIVKLSYEDFLDYYNKYIHPSNSYIGIYGNLDYD